MLMEEWESAVTAKTACFAWRGKSQLATYLQSVVPQCSAGTEVEVTLQKAFAEG